MTWPVAHLDNIGRARVVAATMPNAGVAETFVDVPFGEFWAWATDFERTTPLIDRQLRRVRIRKRQGNRLEMLVWGRGVPVPLPITATIEDGYCLMRGRARLFLVVMAAVPEGSGTRYLHVEAVPLPGSRFLRRSIQRMVESDIRGIERHAPRRPSGE